MRRLPTLAALLVLAAGSTFPAGAQLPAPEPDNLVIPQVRPLPWRERAGLVRLSAVEADVSIMDQVATTELLLTLENPTDRPLETQILLPVPVSSAVRSFQLESAGSALEARILPRDEARRIYEDIVRRTRDPGLVEFMDQHLLRTSVFPVPPRGVQKARIVYEQVLAADLNRVEYVLPRSDAIAASGVTWTCSIRVRAAVPIATLYSPSHELAIERLGPGELRARVTPASSAAPGPLRLAYLTDSGREVTASIISCPDHEAGGGYFMLLAAGLDAGIEIPSLRRELTIVLDRSGSMQGPKIEQARKAALQVITGLREGELFNIVDYSDTVATLAPRPFVRNAHTLGQAEQYLAGIRAVGGTNIHDALLEALRPAPAENTLPIILFLTDGLPTVGLTREAPLRDAIARANTHNRRIFTFGVGFDVNAALLSAIAHKSRGAATFVLPDEDIEVKVGQVFRRLSGPVLSLPRLSALDSRGESAHGAIADILPVELPDVFQGDQVIAVGRYCGSPTGPVRLRLEGDGPSGRRFIDAMLDPAAASAANAYVARLWARRRVGALVDQIRALSADGPLTSSDPRMKELVDEITRLSTRFGILTEYTAFLAVEAGEIRAEHEVLRDLALALEPVAAARSGNAGVNMQMRLEAQYRNPQAMNAAYYIAADNSIQKAEGVRQAGAKSLYRRRQRWMDSELVYAIQAGTRQADEQPDEVIEFASPEYFRLADRLAAQGRQAALAQTGPVELLVDGRRILIQGQ
jgi:Ca-activated chloride channel family protein